MVALPKLKRIYIRLKFISIHSVEKSCHLKMCNIQYPSCLGFRYWVKQDKTCQWLLWAMCMYMTSVFYGKPCIPGTWIQTWLGFKSMMEWNWMSSQTIWFLLEKQDLHCFSVSSLTWTFGATVIWHLTKGTFSMLRVRPSVTRAVEHIMVLSF